MGRSKVSKKKKSKKQHSEFPEPCHINQVDSDGSTPLHKAAADLTKHHLLRELLKTDNRVNCKDHKGDYPLLLALEKGCSLEVLNLLLAAGADVHVKERTYCNALHLSLYGKEISVIEELCCRFPELCAEEDSEAQTPLRHALDMNFNNFDVFKILWQHRTAYYDRFNRSLLSSAVKGACDIQIIETIINEYKSTIYEPDNMGLIPVHFVSSDVKVLKVLIEAGSDLWHEEDNGYIPLRFVLNNNDPSAEVVREFLKHTDRDKLVEEEKAFGYSLLHTASQAWIESIQGGRVGFETLLELGFDPLTKYSGDENVVDSISHCKDSDNLKILLRKYPSIFLECKDVWFKRFAYYERNDADDKGTIKFDENLIKWIAIQDRSLARQTLQPEGSFKPLKYYLSYFEKSLAELKMLRNFKLTTSKSLHDLILEDYMNPTFRTDVSKRLIFWKECENAIAFDANSLTIYKQEVVDVQDIVFSCQLYNERLCTKKNDHQVVFLTNIASERVLNYLDNGDLKNLATALMNPAIWVLKMHLYKLNSFMRSLKDDRVNLVAS